MMIRYNDLFFTCSLIEYIGRETRNQMADVIDKLGKDIVTRIYNYADVFHCEPIEKVANDFIECCQITEGAFDNVARCKYDVPSYWDIGADFARLIEDVYHRSMCFSKYITPGLKLIYPITIRISSTRHGNILRFAMRKDGFWSKVKRR